MKYILLSIACVMNVGFALSQDIHFSQFYNNPVFLNPANAGAINADFRVSTAYRNQWSSVTLPYRTIMMGYDQAIKADSRNSNSFGLGIQFFSDKAGSAQLTTNQVNINMSGRVSIDRNQDVAAGLMVGYGARSVSFEGLAWDNQYQNGYNPSLPTGEPSYSGVKGYVDLGAGIQWNLYLGNQVKTIGEQTLKATFGAGVFHLNQPDIGFSGSVRDNLRIKFVVNGGMQVALPGSLASLIPRFAYIRQGPLSEGLVGTLLKRQLRNDTKYTGFVSESALFAGGFLRIKDAILLTVGIQTSNFRLFASYDVNVSQLRAVSSGRGGIEVSAGYVNTFTRGFSRQKEIKYL